MFHRGFQGESLLAILAKLANLANNALILRQLLRFCTYK